MRKTLGTAALVLALSFTAAAGDIPNPPAVPPPPLTQTADGETHTGAAEAALGLDTPVGSALSWLRGVLSLF